MEENKNPWVEYEERKNDLIDKSLTIHEYEEKIKEISEELGI